MAPNPDPNYPKFIPGWVLPNESLLWMGKPDPHIHLKLEDYVLTLLGLVVSVFALVGLVELLGAWIRSDASNAAPIRWVYIVSVTVDALVLGCGLFLAFVRYFFLKWRILATEYGLTSHRLLIARGDKLGDLLAIDLQDIRDLRVSEGSRRIGTIYFDYGNSDSDLSMGHRIDLISPCVARPALHDIPEAEPVFRLISEAKGQLLTNKANPPR